MIIAISGKAQSGKDTICKMIQYCISIYNVDKTRAKYFGIDDYTKRLHKYDLDWCSGTYIHRFADALKRAVAGILKCDPIFLEDIDFKNSNIDWLNCNGNIKGNITVRQLLQDLGSVVRESFGKTFWAQCLIHEIDGGTFNIIPDLRYKVELETLENFKMSLLTIRVNRPGVQLMDHSSETELDDYKGWDYVIENDGTLEDLLYKVKDFCKEFNLI